MRAATIVDGRIEVVERPVPEPGAEQVLVRVHGAGLNRADLLQRAGAYPAPPGVPADIPGMEFAGIVEAIGPGATGVGIGDRVFGIVGGGGQAEYVVTAASHCAPVPDGLDLVEMGGVPEAFITAHDAMITQAGLRAGEWLLVNAVGSGVGTAGLQLAKALGAHGRRHRAHARQARTLPGARPRRRHRPPHPPRRQRSTSRRSPPTS